MIQSIAVFLMAATLLGTLIPDEKYERYYKFYVSLILVLLILNPVIGFLQNTGLMSIETQNAFSELNDVIDSNSNSGSLLDTSSLKQEELYEQASLICNEYMENETFASEQAKDRTKVE